MPTLDMWTCAPEASTALIASHTSDSTTARSYTSRGSARSGGLSSVTANRPARSTRSSRPRDECPGRGGSGSAGSTSRRSSGRSSEAARAPPPARRSCPCGDDRRAAASDDPVALAHPARAFPGLHPDTAHLRLDLAMPVGAHPAAGAVAHLLGTVHRAGHAGRAEHALAAHLAVEQQALDVALDQRRGPFQPREADALEQAPPRRRPARTAGRTVPRTRHGGSTKGARRTFRAQPLLTLPPFATRSRRRSAVYSASSASAAVAASASRSSPHGTGSARRHCSR